MANVRMTMWLMVMVLMVFCLGLPEAQATIVFCDGGTHTVNWAIYDNVNVQNNQMNHPTTLNLVTGGWIEMILSVYNSSQVNISGGSMANYIEAYGSSQVNISAGLISHDLWAREISQVNISGGWIGEDLCAYDNSYVNITGGWIRGTLYARDNSQATIYGSGFNYPYGTITGHGILTGSFPNGDPISILFSADPTAGIVLIPEPATLFLLGLGAVFLRKSAFSHCHSVFT
ncbi:MAG: PEP-CTERM sorting domain-containing protein [Sedimentisphaerales bacterium]|nr:PEP-CTERM sorting domain-containing protein [Sedimentisphaerales bacterium]